MMRGMSLPTSGSSSRNTPKPNRRMSAIAEMMRNTA